jgi:hypothetical protein
MLFHYFLLPIKNKAAIATRIIANAHFNSGGKLFGLAKSQEQ